VLLCAKFGPDLPRNVGTEPRKCFKTIIHICMVCVVCTHLACYFHCLFEPEGLLNVTGSHSHIHCKFGNISVTGKDRVVVTKDH